MTEAKKIFNKSLNIDLKDLIQLSNTKFNNSDQYLAAYINFCKQKIGFENVIVSEIVDDKYRILLADTVGDLIKKNMVIPLCDTICKDVFVYNKTIAKPYLEDKDLYNLPASKLLNIESIICSPIKVDNKIVGTITLCSTSVKKDIDEFEYFTNLVDLLAVNISHVFKEKKDEIEINRKNESLISYNSDLNDLIRIGIEHFDDLSTVLMQYIDLGKQITGFENGFVSKIEGQKYLVLESSTINDKLKKGAVFQLCDTLCQEVVDNAKTVVHGTLKTKKQYDLPGRSFLNTQAVIGTPIFVNGKIVGTLTFSSIREKHNKNELNYFQRIVELIALNIGKCIKEKEIQNQLKQDKELLDLGAEFLQMATYMRTISTGIVSCTETFFDLYELDKNEVAKSDLSLSQISLNTVVDEDKAYVNQIFQKSSTEDLPPFEYRIRKKDGTIRWLRHKLKRDIEGGFVLGVVQNISLIKKMQTNLEKQNAELEQFAYATAHDLQEPLRTISGYADIINQLYNNQLDERGQQFFSFIGEAAIRMKEQIDGLLLHSKIGREKTKVVVNAHDLVKDVLADLRQSISLKDANIKLEYLPTIKAFKTELRILFLNLISNAIKFSNPEKQPIIKISYKEDDIFWRFYITDNGIGIKKEDIPKIFKLFSRLNERSLYEGTGIGLAHCKKIVDLHGGNIEVQSELGKGTIFCFSVKK